MSAADLEYYESLEDYNQIAEYLDLSPITIDESALPNFTPDFSCAIIVDGIPVVSREKSAKLLVYLQQIYSQTAPITENDIYLPFNELGKSCGFCFIKFAKKEDALQAIKVTNGLAIDKNHTFRVSAYSDLDKYDAISENDQPPKLDDFHARPSGDSWLCDELNRDQFAVRHSKETEIYWANSTGEEPSLVYGAEREKAQGKLWCELNVEWSPQGTYFVTYHKAGVKLWGGSDFQPHGKFMHPQVEEISFSPCEDYIITYRLTDLPGTDPNSAIIVWDVRTGEKLRQFSKKSAFDVKFQVQATVTVEAGGRRVEKSIRGKVKSSRVEGGQLLYSIEEGSTVHDNIPAKNVQATQDPNKLKWSSDGKYLARLGPDMISIYELPTLALLDKRSLTAKDVQDFVWSPKSNLIAYWSPASVNHPAIINIVSIPDRAEICTKNLFDVHDGKMSWQDNGDYLCVHMTKITPRKKSYVLMFFRVKTAGVPVEQTEIDDPVLNVHWEPSGDRVAVMRGDVRSPQITFYSMSNHAAPANTKDKSGKVQTTVRNELTKLFTKAGVQCNDFQWSPAGGVVSIAYFATETCLFELFDVDNNTSFASRKHDRCTKLLWDPSGRYLASCTVTALRNAHAKGNPDDGVQFFTFQGNLLCHMRREKLFTFAWRPRPNLLTAEEKKEVMKNIKNYEKEFEKKDKMKKQEINQGLQASRFRIAEEFLSWKNGNRTACAALKAKRVELRNGYDSDDERNYRIERMVDETILKTVETVEP